MLSGVTAPRLFQWMEQGINICIPPTYTFISLVIAIPFYIIKHEFTPTVAIPSQQHRAHSHFPFPPYFFLSSPTVRNLAPSISIYIQNPSPCAQSSLCRQLVDPGGLSLPPHFFAVLGQATRTTSSGLVKPNFGLN